MSLTDYTAGILAAAGYVSLFVADTLVPFALLLLAAAVVLIVGDIVRFLRPELERYFERAREIARGEREL